MRVLDNQGDGAFCTTQWSEVVRAAQSGEHASGALEALCANYWFPLYAYLRRKGKTPEDAQDLVQGFFEHILSGDFLCRADKNRGKFRTFLINSLNNFMANHYAYQGRAKRGGGEQVLSFDMANAEGQYLLEPVENITPEVLFERSWAKTVVDSVAAKLRGEYERAGEMARYELIRPYLMGLEAEDKYSEIAPKLELTEGGVKTLVRRMRLRFRDLLRKELEGTVSDPSQINEEIRTLLLALARAT